MLVSNADVCLPVPSAGIDPLIRLGYIARRLRDCRPYDLHRHSKPLLPCNAVFFGMAFAVDVVAQQLAIFDGIPRTVLVFKSSGKQCVGLGWRYSIGRGLQKIRYIFAGSGRVGGFLRRFRRGRDEVPPPEVHSPSALRGCEGS